MIAERRGTPYSTKEAPARRSSTKPRRPAPSNAAVECARQALRHLIELSGLSRRQVAQRLLEQDSGTDLARVLSGRLALKLHHILSICGVLGIHPLEFFGMVFKQPEQRSALLQRLEGLIAPHPPLPPQPAVSREEFAELSRRMTDLERDIEKLLDGRVPAHLRHRL